MINRNKNYNNISEVLDIINELTKRSNYFVNILSDDTSGYVLDISSKYEFNNLDDMLDNNEDMLLSIADEFYYTGYDVEVNHHINTCYDRLQEVEIYFYDSNNDNEEPLFIVTISNEIKNK